MLRATLARQSRLRNLYFTDKKFLERSPVVASVALGLVHAWVGRYSLDPDGISYLDMGEALVRRDWQSAINAYWSPLFHLAKVTEKNLLENPVNRSIIQGHDFSGVGFTAKTGAVAVVAVGMWKPCV